MIPDAGWPVPTPAPETESRAYYSRDRSRLYNRTTTHQKAETIMNIFRPIFLRLPILLSVVLSAAGIAAAQQAAPQSAKGRFDITNYRIEAQLIPDQHTLRAGADINLTLL